MMDDVKQCEICSATASVFLTQIINGKSTKVALCAQCAKERGVLDPSAFDLAEKLFSPPPPGQTANTGAGAQVHFQPQPVSTHLPLTVCPSCGFTIEDYRRVGRLGCSRCYDVFNEEIAPVLNEIHGHATHTGKKPEHAVKRVRQVRDMSQLREQLDAAIKREDYEAAARLRDAIGLIEVSD